MKSLVGDRPSWHKEPINFLNKMLLIRKVRLLITSRYIAMQSSECVIISKMFLIYFISYGCNGGALVFLGGAEASASPSFALPMFITIKTIIFLHLFLGVCGWHRHTLAHPWLRPWYSQSEFGGWQYLCAAERRFIMMVSEKHDCAVLLLYNLFLQYILAFYLFFTLSF